MSPMTGTAFVLLAAMAAIAIAALVFAAEQSRRQTAALAKLGRAAGELDDARQALEAERDRHHVTSMQLALADKRAAELEIALERKNIAGRYFGRNADKGRQMIVDRLDNPPPGP